MLAAEIWAGAQLFATAAEKAHLGNKITSAEVTKALDSVSNNTLDGLAPPLTFTNGNQDTTCGYEFNVKAGKFDFLHGGKLQCPAQ